jgi:tRNA threonylcarbamoyladenosine biosynthesis protein TsaB
VNILGIDTATAASATCVLRADGQAFEHPVEPARLAERPAHATELMPAIDDVMTQAGIGFADLDAVAVGLGPGTFTGLRIGVATARALALGTGAEVVPVSTLRALALRVADEGAGGAVLAVLDARRGEAFAAAWDGERRLLGPVAVVPEALGDLVGAAPGPWRAVGDGAVRFRDHLEAAAVAVPPDGSELHHVSALATCRLARDGRPVPVAALVPEYVRAPDAVERRRT